MSEIDDEIKIKEFMTKSTSRETSKRPVNLKRNIRVKNCGTKNHVSSMSYLTHFLPFWSLFKDCQAENLRRTTSTLKPNSFS